MELTGKAGIRAADAHGETRKAIVWSTPGFKDKAFHRYGLCAEGDLIYSLRSTLTRVYAFGSIMDFDKDVFAHYNSIVLESTQGVNSAQQTILLVS